MGEEVVVTVRQKGTGDAVSKTKREIDELEAAAARYEAGGHFDLAKSARSDAGQLQKGVSAAEKEAAALVKDATAKRLADERLITREKAKQAAEDKLANSTRGRLIRAGAQFAESQAGVGGFGGVTSALGGAGGTAGIIAAAAAAIAAAVGGAVFKDREEREGGLIHIGNERSQDRRQIGLMRTFRGDSGQARADVDQTNEEIAAREDKRAELAHAAKPGMFDPRRWSNAAFGTNFQTWSGQRDIAGNEGEIDRLKQRKAEVEKVQKELFDRDHADELNAKRKEGAGDMRGAWALRKRSEWNQEYQSKLKEWGEGREAEAQESASMKLYNQEKQKRMEVAAGLVNARSGARDVSRAAEFAGGANDISRNIASAIDGLHETVKTQGSTLLDRPMTRNFRK